MNTQKYLELKDPSDNSIIDTILICKSSISYSIRNELKIKHGLKAIHYYFDFKMFRLEFNL